MTSPSPGSGNPPAPVLSYRGGTDMQPATMGVLNGCFWGSVGLAVLGLLCIMAGASSRSESGSTLGVVMLLMAFPFYLGTIVHFLVKVYRAWKIIQPLRQLDATERGMPTPGQAVGFLFIPFFNVYWVFVAYRSLAVRGNKYLRIAGLAERVTHFDESTSTLLCVLTVAGLVVGLVPRVNIVAVGLLYVMLVWISKVNRTTNELIAALA